MSGSGEGKTDIPGAEATKLRAAQWQIEREEPKAVKEQLAEGDRQAAEMNEQRDKNDPDYKPTGEDQRGEA